MENKNKAEEIKIGAKEERIFSRSLRDLWDSIPVPFCGVNLSFIVSEVGESFKNKFGHNEEEAVGKNFEDIFCKREDFERVKQKIEKEREVKSYDALLKTKEGRTVFASIFGKPRRDEKGKIFGYIFSFLDISSKKKIEKELQEKIKDLERSASELKNSRAALLNILEDIEEARGSAENEKDKTVAIIENFPEGLLFFSPSGKLSSANERAGIFFDLSKEDILGKTPEELLQFRNIEPVMRVLLDKKSEGQIKKEFELKKGLVLEASYVSVRKKDGIVGTLVILRNITREKVIEKLKTEFVSISAHQLRTPLSAIKWTLRMILDGDVGAISEEQKDFLGRTYQSNERMIRLINDLLNVTRIEEGRFLYNVKNEDIERIVENVFNSSKDAAKAKNIDFVFEKPERKGLEAEVDSEKISLVVQNFIDNAIHYTDSGGRVEVSINCHRKNKEIVVSISDTGIGISPDQQTRVFTKFFRGANAVRSETEGTGLGLYIAKNIIESHKGKIWFESIEKKGSTFYFTLPLVEK